MSYMFSWMECQLSRGMWVSVWRMITGEIQYSTQHMVHMVNFKRKYADMWHTSKKSAGWPWSNSGMFWSITIKWIVVDVFPIHVKPSTDSPSRHPQSHELCHQDVNTKKERKTRNKVASFLVCTLPIILCPEDFNSWYSVYIHEFFFSWKYPN